ncbi:MAG: alpha/beta hydrolase family protein, partial [Desulfococcaceae bacterium]
METPIRFQNQDGEKIIGTLHAPEESTRAGVVLGHCFTCSRHTSILRDISRELQNSGLAALRFDFSGNGQSEGDFARTTYTRHIDEMRRAAELLRDRGYDRIGLAGHSMGASIAVLSGAELEGVRGICALAGRLAGIDPGLIFSQNQLEELRETGEVHFQSRGRDLTLRKEFFEDARRYDVPEIVATLPAPLLVVHGDQDDIIPVQNAYEAQSRNPDVELFILPGADHMFGDSDHRRRIAERVARWFQTHLQPESTER